MAASFSCLFPTPLVTRLQLLDIQKVLKAQNKQISQSKTTQTYLCCSWIRPLVDNQGLL